MGDYGSSGSVSKDKAHSLIKQARAVKIYHLDLNHLIIDATRIKIWKDKETDLIRFGYCSRNERKSLPQVSKLDPGSK
ncbi:MAG: hypothetical protein KKD69_08490 [Euryarchaeota archaeon]|nr:hypothetical protein [Euryarchaeota archaeon]MBU4492483.1 hypothetical protein [Euryarchaeota archaeon]